MVSCGVGSDSIAKQAKMAITAIALSSQLRSQQINFKCLLVRKQRTTRLCKFSTVHMHNFVVPRYFFGGGGMHVVEMVAINFLKLMKMILRCKI